MQLLRSMIGALILVTCSSATAIGCQCLVQASACADYWRADAVFVGSVTNIVPSFDDFETSVRTKNRKVTFTIKNAYRGSLGAQVELQDWINSCEFRFEKGHHYLVYAYRNSEDNTLGTHGCSRTTEVAHATEDLTYINALTRGAAHQDIAGIIQDPFSKKPVVGMTVIATTAGRKLKSVSDRNGNFKIPLRRGGHYTVKIYLPSTYSIGGPAPYIDRIKTVATTSRQTVVEYDLNLVTGQCEYLVIPAAKLGDP